MRPIDDCKRFALVFHPWDSPAINGEDGTVTPQSMLQVSRLCAASIVGLVVAVHGKTKKKWREIRLYSHTNSREWIHEPWSVPGIRQVLSESGQSAFSGL